MRHKLKYYINNIKTHWSKPVWWKNMFIRRFLAPLIYSNDGIYVLNEEWDNLIILDSCRFDSFEREVKKWDIKGKLEYRISRGSNTAPFLLENFRKRDNAELSEIIYITANPYVNKFLKGKFWKIVSVWDFGWDENLGTILPEPVCQAALKAAKNYQGKKLIVHFLQPHGPYIKKRKSKCEAHSGIKRVREELRKGRRCSSDAKPTGRNIIWRLSEEVKKEKDIEFQEYIENLRIVLPYVKKLCELLPRRTVVTADHGQAFGEKMHKLIPLKVYSHPVNIRIEPSVKVPWFIVDNEKDFTKIEKELAKLKIAALKSDGGI